MKRMPGELAKANYDKARQAVREGRFEDARAVELLPSDRSLIEEYIAKATPAAPTTDDYPSPY